MAIASTPSFQSNFATAVASLLGLVSSFSVVVTGVTASSRRLLAAGVNVGYTVNVATTTLTSTTTSLTNGAASLTSSLAVAYPGITIATPTVATPTPTPVPASSSSYAPIKSAANRQNMMGVNHLYGYTVSMTIIYIVVTVAVTIVVW